MPKTAILAARFREEVAWFRLLAAAGRLERALKYNPNWHLQPRVPAGNGRESGQWADGGGVSVVPVSGPASRIARLRRRYPGASLAEITQLDIAVSQARYHVNRVRRLDPNWRGPTSITSTIRGEINHFRARAQEAQKRFEELTQGAIPKFDPTWGRKRLLNELRKAGYRYKEPAEKGQGVIYRNDSEGTEVRIMKRPDREPPPRTRDHGKWLMKYYYRYKIPNLGEGQHVPIPDG